MKPLVTLITPVYNALPYFGQYLESVIKQTWRPLEFVVADDGSTDGSMQCLNSKMPVFESSGITVKIIKLKHFGQAAAINAALKAVCGEFLTWCDADDLLTMDSIEKKVKFLLENGEYGMVRSDGIVADADTGVEICRSANKKDAALTDIFEPLFFDKMYCYAGCYMLRTSLLFKCYPNRQIPLSPEGQNLQLLLPVASRTKCGFIPETLHYYRRHKNSHSNQSRSYSQSIQRLKNFSTLKLALLPYCNCNKEKFTAEIKKLEEYYKHSLIKAALQKARKEILK